MELNVKTPDFPEFTGELFRNITAGIDTFAILDTT